MKVSELLKTTKGKLLSGDPDRAIEPSKISTDSRAVKEGAFFIALKGPRFDGADYADEAFRKGAIGALMGHRKPAMKDRRKVIIMQVADTTKALEDIAAHHRMKFEIPVIAVTGSNGKTATKDMIWQMLSTNYHVLRNEGTKNNNIGVSQTLLQLKKSHDICVLELGTNHKGEIARLGHIAKPSLAVITNIGPSHLESLGTLQGVFEAKKEMLGYFHHKGLVILNGDDKFLSRIKDPKINIARFGLGKSNDFRAADIYIDKESLEFLLNGRHGFKLKLLGIHNIYNALAAIAVASQFGITYDDMSRALLDYRPGDMRLNLKSALDGVNIIDDSYNSNPLSMKMALEVLKRYPARSKWVVCGDMLELGMQGRYFHKRMGRQIARSGVKGFLAFGALSKTAASQARRYGMDNVWHCSTHDEIAGILKRVTSKGDLVLIKGSRGMKMEETIRKL